MAKNYASVFVTFLLCICTTTIQLDLLGEGCRLINVRHVSNKLTRLAPSSHALGIPCSCLVLDWSIKNLSIDVFSSHLFLPHEHLPHANQTTLTGSISSPAYLPTPSVPPSTPAPSPRSYHVNTCHVPSTPPASTPNQTRHVAPAPNALQ